MASSDVFRAQVGTKDVIGIESRHWQSLITLFGRLAHLYNYDLAINPTFENIEVFKRLGEDTDVVTKEMYDFMDKGGRHIALRPEGTAGIVRSFAQLRPLTPFKCWYFVSNFRYERPQKGRLREHHQLGIEALGIDDPAIDVEVIKFAYDYLKMVGLNKFVLNINSLGDAEAREKHMKELKSYFSKHYNALGDEFKERVERNPFRMLDTKVDEYREVVNGAPSIFDFLSDESIDSFNFVKSSLEKLNIDFVVNPSLVRGLDYYTNTAFEFISSSLDAAQSTICGGGRYNKLVSQMGGPETSGIGFGLGVERLLLVLESENIDLELRNLDVVILDLVKNDVTNQLSFSIQEKLRSNNISVDVSYGDKSMKSAMKYADRLDAKIAVIIGQNELEKGTVSLKNLNSGEQSEINVDSITQSIAKML
ncbi:MAG: histidine--tRNA ligase [Acidimicrobiia bacterium]